MKDKKKKEGQPEELNLLDQDKVIKEPGQKTPFWKPIIVGETRIGKLMRISSSKFGQVLAVSTLEGSCLISVGTFLSDVDFVPYIGKNLYFRYEGTAGTRNMRLFRVILLVS